MARGNPKDLTGQKFGRLTALYYDHSRNYVRYWKCKCQCGNESLVATSKLTTGYTRSCGCLKKGKYNYKHGLRGHRLYRIWSNMKTRCFNKRDPHFERWGGRGITVCDEWKNDFESFYNWAMSNGYSDKLSIDRIDNDGNYEPSNCRWATDKQQNNNKRNVKKRVIPNDKPVSTSGTCPQ